MHTSLPCASSAALVSGSPAWSKPPSLCSFNAHWAKTGTSRAAVRHDQRCKRHVAHAGAIAALEHASLLGTVAAAPGLPAVAGLDLQVVALLDLQSSLSSALYGVSQDADALVQQQLSGLTPLSLAVIFLAGLATSLSPCTLSVLPLTIGYIGGYAGQQQRPQQQQQQEGVHVPTMAEPGASQARLPAQQAQQQQQQQQQQRQRQQPALGPQALSFAAGLATTLALLGVSSSLLGRAYGQIGSGLPLAVALVAIAMGLNLLEVVPLRLPSLDVDVRKLSIPPAAQAYLAGATFALAASPCSTPVLATLLAYVSATKDPLQGGALLLAYTGGYVVPLLVAASATGAVKQLLSLRQYSAWVTPASGVLLVAGGTYALLSRLVPA